MKWRQMMRMPMPYTKASSSISANVELRSRNAEWMAASKHGMPGNQIALQKLFYKQTHAPVHHQFGPDHQGQRHQEADVNFRIHQEGNGQPSAYKLSIQCREQQQR